MKKGIHSITFLILLSSNLFGQERQIFDPKLSPYQKIETKIGIVDVILEYHRPSMRGRKIFGHLVPYDQIWRTGANINTKITFGSNIIIEDTHLDAGTYTIFTKPGKDEWQIIIHTELNQFGVPDIINEENILVQISKTPVELQRSIETLTMNFDSLTANSALLGISWENIYLPIPIKVPTGDVLTEILDRERITLMEDYRAAAIVYFRIEKNSNLALTAINQSIGLLLNGKTFEDWLESADLKDRHLPNKYRLKSEILASLGKVDEAIAFAELSLIIAEKVNDQFYIDLNEKNINKWKSEVDE